VKKYKYLSYFLDKETPIYGGSKGIDINPLSQISNGDSANTCELRLHNHSGTHIDFPKHFILNGKVSNDYHADFWIFNKPYVIKLKCEFDQLIDFRKNDIESIPNETDFLIVNTGFHKRRGEREYWFNNPGFTPDSAKKIRMRCPNLRILGMDTISLTSYQNREIGRISHKEYLNKHDILIVEDINLNDVDNEITKIYCFPMLVKGIDGAPVTIIAEFDE
jgi:kynurenine formamidase